MRRILVIAFLAMAVLNVLAVSPVAAQAPAQQPQSQAQQQNDFVPVKDLPAQEKMPAAPLVTAAYAFVWVVLVLYVWSLSRRVKKVQSELTELRQRSRSNR